MARNGLRGLCLVCVAAMGLLLAGCGVSFVVATPKGFVELKDQEPHFDYRAVNADGVVIAVREIEHEPKGDTDFWIQAIRSQMREKAGYALLEEKKVTTRSGLKGTQLRFGHDEENESMLYCITVFVTDKYIYVIEFGGTKEQMTNQRAHMDWVVDSFRKK